MKNLSAMLMVCALLVGCATAPAPQLDATLFADAKFEPASEPIRAADVFAVSPEMKAYLAGGIVGRLHNHGRTEVLVDALYKKSELRLEYDSVMTRNAAQAFAARSGNCLSLVIMTAAFAKELGVPVRYQSVVTDELWGRDGGIDFVIDHVNITLGQRMGGAVWAGPFTDAVTIDFLPPQDLRGQRQHVITEATVLAMFMNNRAAESLAQGHVDAAYWWAREALVQEPGFVRALNTLGVVYRRHGDLPEAERALRTAYAKQPSNPQIVFNLAQVLADQGQAAEARTLRTRLAQLQPEAPFSYFDRGRIALSQGDVKGARDLFLREVERAPYNPEFHYWLAVTYARLGDVPAARKQLEEAMEASSTRGDRELYAAKLERIRAHTTQ
jgi:tetratricopeptide (TPR) repeat protein